MIDRASHVGAGGEEGRLFSHQHGALPLEQGGKWGDRADAADVGMPGHRESREKGQPSTRAGERIERSDRQRRSVVGHARQVSTGADKESMPGNATSFSALVRWRSAANGAWE